MTGDANGVDRTDGSDPNDGNDQTDGDDRSDPNDGNDQTDGDDRSDPNDGNNQTDHADDRGAVTGNGTDDRTSAAAPPSGAIARVTVASDDVEFRGSDVALLRAIADAGSVSGAAAELGRSRARALNRLETLEGAFGPLVERTRGGADGGGSRLTESGSSLLARYDRLQHALLLSAQAPETVLSGKVGAVDGELATVVTPVGDVRALHDGLAVGDAAQVRVGADAVTVQDVDSTPAAEETSARNRFRGMVTSVDPGETVVKIRVRIDADEKRDDGEQSTENDRLPTVTALLTVASVDRLDLSPGRVVTVSWKATATAATPRSGVDGRVYGR